MNTTSVSSGLRTADATVKTGKGIITDVIINTDGVNAATLIIYDNTSAAGTVVFKAQVVGADLAGVFSNLNTRCDNGLFADVTGVGADYIVHYK
jgi:hypothetical protein